MVSVGQDCRTPNTPQTVAERASLPRLAQVAALVATLALGACGGSDKIEVERSAALPSDAQNAAFIVLKAKGQDNTKDYGKFADQVAARLTAKGLRRVEDPAQARLAVMFSYDGDGVANAAEERRRNHPDKKIDDGKVERGVSLTVYDLTRAKQYNEAVFGASAQCIIPRTNSDPSVIAALLDAVLQDFPGKTQEHYSVDLPSAK